MTTILLSPPSGSTSSSAPMPTSNKSVLMRVTVDTSKEESVADTDSPTSTSVELKLESEQEVNVEPEVEQYDENESVVGIATCVENVVAAATLEQRFNKKRRRVSFECADIIEFEPTVYTTSVTSGGVPVGLSLNERSRSRRRLDSFEMERQDERVGRQSYMEEGYLDPQEREIILNNAGCEDPVIASVEAEVNAIIQLRRESNEVDCDFMYGISEIKNDEEDIEEEEEVVKVSTLGQEESEGKQENNAEKDAVTREKVAVEQKVKSALLETRAGPGSDDEPEAASI